MEGIKIKVLKSGVKNIQQTSTNLPFDADHEARYAKMKFFSAEECNEFSEKYTSTPDALTSFLKGSIIIKDLVSLMEDY